jgi:peptide/nickel transport system permease protein
MDTLTDSATVAVAAPPLLAGTAGRRLLRNPAVIIGAAILAVILLLGLAAPWLGTVDPVAINPSVRNKLPGFEETVRNDDGGTSTIVHRMGTDTLGRDVYSRTLYGARVSMLVGVAVATISVALGLSIGLLGWSGCPILEVDVPTASRNKSLTMQLGTMLFILGSIGAMFTVLLGAPS